MLKYSTVKPDRRHMVPTSKGQEGEDPWNKVAMILQQTKAKVKDLIT